MRTVAILSLLLACCHTNKSINMRPVECAVKRFEPRPVSESGPKLFPHKQENIIPLKDAPGAEIQRNKRGRPAGLIRLRCSACKTRLIQWYLVTAVLLKV